jgi:hypothetical protein
MQRLNKMGNTIYASFADPSLAEKAAGALLDHGVRSEDLSIVSSHTDASGQTTTSSSSYGASRGDGDNDLKNAGDAGMGYMAAAGDKVAEAGNRTMAGIHDALGNDAGEAKYEAAADRQNRESHQHMGAAGSEARDATDMSGSGGTTSRSTDTDSGDDIENSAKHGISTTTGADAGAGAVKGAGWGLGIGAAAALASLFIPGVGLVVGGGALATALGGLAAATGAGAAAGAVTGYLKDQGVDEHVAADYDRTVQGGGAVLAVTAPSGDCSREEIQEVLTKYGASNVNAYEARTGGGYVA